MFNMILRKISTLVVILTWMIHSASLGSSPDVLKLVPNSSPPAANSNEFISVFSPRMDFDRWKPLTGRGDPLRNDPTYDYEPPVLERVHYWADDTRVEREKHPERKSEVLVLGVSSRKPSIAPRPPMPSRRHPRPPPMPTKYEDFSYKVSENYPMTILVPPPPPPPGHKPVLFTTLNDNLPLSTTPKYSVSTLVTRDSTSNADLITSFAFQEANLIYQSSTKQDWREEYNKTLDLPNVAVSSDYAGWGPTTPFDDDGINESHNIIPHNTDLNLGNKKISFYTPIIPEISPAIEITSSFTSPIFLPTVFPPTSEKITQATLSNYETTSETITKNQNDYEPTTTEESTTIPLKKTSVLALKPKPNIVDMLAPMMSMPTTDPDRPEDNIYAHASENMNVFSDQKVTDEFKLEVMQTMQPPPPVDFSESTTLAYDQDSHVDSFNTLLYDKHSVHTHDPYLHMRYTKPLPTTELISEDNKHTTEKQAIPTYLIIQGHSKVKTYSSKPKSPHSSLKNVIPNPNETNEVKHLHPIKEKFKNIQVKSYNRDGRAKNLKSLVDNGLGSIEIQETDIGIKYDVSDGSEVPAEIYKKGIVDNDENNYVITKKNNKERTKRQIDIENLLPFDEDTLEEFVYNFFQTRKNSTGILGFIAKAITDNKISSVIDDLEDDDNENDKDR